MNIAIALILKVDRPFYKETLTTIRIEDEMPVKGYQVYRGARAINGGCSQHVEGSEHSLTTEVFTLPSGSTVFFQASVKCIRKNTDCLPQNL